MSIFSEFQDEVNIRKIPRGVPVSAAETCRLNSRHYKTRRWVERGLQECNLRQNVPPSPLILENVRILSTTDKKLRRIGGDFFVLTTRRSRARRTTTGATGWVKIPENVAAAKYLHNYKRADIQSTVIVKTCHPEEAQTMALTPPEVALYEVILTLLHARCDVITPLPACLKCTVKNHFKANVNVRKLIIANAAIMGVSLFMAPARNFEKWW
uniref:Uncharacterized protein n=1 Tax=Branchiostoma floridae TaxID=7739 RepID=C3Z2P2_BRAFL|eukprot:XP_002597281.1 hypothetical protein BRAFLDRAFT_66419 [Branchiostoma floridae]